MSLESYILDIQKEKNPKTGDRLVLSLLGGLEKLYTKGVLKKRAKDSALAVKADIPVISVGNLTAGGTGKTPCIIKMAELFLKKGVRPAVVTRGYRGKLEKTGGVVSDMSGLLLSEEEAGDEPFMMASRLPGVPVLVGRNRILSAEKAVAMGADVILMDDGFQYWKLKRDLDIVLIDATNPFGYGHVLPRGLLREPLDALKRAGVFVLTKTNQVTKDKLAEIIEDLKKENPEAPILYSTHRPSGLLEASSWKRGTHGSDFSEMKGQKAFLFSGIGNPAAFRKTAEEAGLAVAGEEHFEDHHKYAWMDMEQVERKARDSGASILVTTEKDIVKISELPNLPCYVLEITMTFGDEDEKIFEKCVEDVL